MAEAGAEEVAALVAGKVAGVLSGADQASYLLDLQIALHPTNHDCTTRDAPSPCLQSDDKRRSRPRSRGGS